jgi:N-acetylmuramic acid 6-phosphate (MurNAc-6-P) etherase
MLSGLKTERQNRASTDLDKLSALEIATLMNRQDARVLRAVRRALPAIAKAIDVVRDRLAAGGRLIYVGSGTSGRIGALDASECPPTFGIDPAMIQYVIAGGNTRWPTPPRPARIRPNWVQRTWLLVSPARRMSWLAWPPADVPPIPLPP